jgi:hypothetical protein
VSGNSFGRFTSPNQTDFIRALLETKGALFKYSYNTMGMEQTHRLSTTKSSPQSISHSENRWFRDGCLKGRTNERIDSMSSDYYFIWDGDVNNSIDNLRYWSGKLCIHCSI